MNEERKKCPVDHDSPHNNDNVDPFLYYAYAGKMPKRIINNSDNNQFNEDNMMPNLSQKPISDKQKHPLSTKRLVSTIPKGDFTPTHQKNVANDNWVYPSQQQFYNAMMRKGWKPNEEDMRQVLAIHNTVNEKAWNEVLKWERLHSRCDCPKLVKFQGRPKDISPKAQVLSWFGYALPFDRHDWIVDRCGTQVRYIIDFYTGKPSPSKPLSMHIDARPAVDSVSSILDRLILMPLSNLNSYLCRFVQSKK